MLDFFKNILTNNEVKKKQTTEKDDNNFQEKEVKLLVLEESMKIIDFYKQIDIETIKIENEINELKTKIDDVFITITDFINIFSKNNYKYPFKSTKKIVGVNSEKNKKLLEFLLTNLKNNYVSLNISDFPSDFKETNPLFYFYNQLLFEFSLSLGNRKSPEFISLISSTPICFYIAENLSPSTYQNLIIVLEHGLKTKNYAFVDEMFDKIYNSRNEFSENYFNYIYNKIIDNIKYNGNSDSIKKELLTKWADSSNNKNYALLVLNSNTSKKNNNLEKKYDELLSLSEDIVLNKDRIYRVVFDLKKHNVDRVLTILKKIVNDNYEKALDNFEYAEAIYCILSWMYIPDDFEFIEKVSNLAILHENKKEVAQYKINLAFTNFFKSTFLDFVSHKNYNFAQKFGEIIISLNNNTPKVKEVEVSQYISFTITTNQRCLKEEILYSIIPVLKNKLNSEYELNLFYNLLKKNNDTNLLKYYSDMLEENKIEKGEYSVEDILKEVLNDDNKIVLINECYNKIITSLRKKDYQNINLYNVMTILANNYNFFENLSSSTFFNIEKMFFQILEYVDDKEIINNIISDKLIVKVISERLTNYSMFNETSTEESYIDYDFYSSLFLALFKNYIYDINLLNILKNIINNIKDKKTKNNFLNLLNKYEIFISSVTDENIIDINNFIINDIFEMEKRGIKISDTYSIFIMKLSKTNYKLVDMVLLEYLSKKDNDEYYDEDNIIKVDASIFRIFELLDIEIVDNILKFSERLSNYFFANCSNNIYILMKLRNQVDLFYFKQVLEYIIENVPSKESFIMKCLSSLNYRKIITKNEMEFFSKYVFTCNDDKLKRKYELLKNKLEENK